MIVHGRVTFRRIAVASCSAAFGSRYSLTNFTEFLFQSAHLLEAFENALGLFLVDHADGESHVDENVFTHFGFGGIGKADFFADAAEIDFGRTEGNIVGIDDFDDLPGNRETHRPDLQRPQGLKPRMRNATDAALKGHSSTSTSHGL